MVVSTDGALCSVMQYVATRCSVLPASRLLACELMVRQFAYEHDQFRVTSPRRMRLILPHPAVGILQKV